MSVPVLAIVLMSAAAVITGSTVAQLAGYDARHSRRRPRSWRPLTPPDRVVSHSPGLAGQVVLSPTLAPSAVSMGLWQPRTAGFLRSPAMTSAAAYGLPDPPDRTVPVPWYQLP